MKSINIGKIFVIIILNNICNLGIAQNYSTEEIPSPRSYISRAELYSGHNNSLHIIGQASRDSDYCLLITTRNEDGFTNDYTVIDSGDREGGGFYELKDVFTLAVGKDRSGKLLIAWTKQNIFYDDIANNPDYYGASILKIGIWHDNSFTVLNEFSNQENPDVKSDSVDFHLVRQSVSPIKDQYFESDSNYYITSSKVLYSKINSDGNLDGTIQIGKGFFPKVHVSKNENIHFLWLAADSCNSKYFQLMYRKKTTSGLEPAITIKDSVHGDWNRIDNIHNSPIDYFSYVDDSGIVYAGWTDYNDYDNGKIYFAQLYTDMTIRIDSLCGLNLWGSQATFKVTSLGEVHVLWLTYQNDKNTLHYSQAKTNDSLFSDVRSYKPLFGAYGFNIIYLNDNNISDGILQLHSTVGYFKDLLNGEDTTLVIAKWSLAYGFTQPKQFNSPTESFAVDQAGQMWLLSQRASESVKLVKFDLLPINLESKNIYPENFSLSQNYPNPFNPLTNIRFFIPKTEFVEINIFNIAGQNIKSFGKNKYMSGTHQITFDGSIFASGIYFVQMKAGNFTDVKKMVLVK